MVLKQSLILALAGLAAAGCVSRGTHNKVVNELAETKQRLKEVDDLAQEYASELSALKGQKSSVEGDLNRLRTSQGTLAADYERRLGDLQRQLAEASKKASGPAGIPGVETLSTGDAFTYRVSGELLFDPGSDKLKPSGVKTLGEVASQLKAHSYSIEVAGHTDTDPVTATKSKYPEGNIQLGASRAISVWRALKDAGVSESRLRVSSHGQYQPVDPKDKSKNRRVEIRVLLKEAARTS